MLRKAVVWVCLLMTLLTPCMGLGEKPKTVLVDAITDPAAL